MEHWKNTSAENIKEFVEGIGWIEEEWKPIEGYELYYEISSFGRARSLDRIRASNNGRMAFLHGNFLGQNTAKQGYLKIVLCKNGKAKTFLAHRLVAKAFIEPVPSKPFINHKFGSKADNRFHQLEWSTQSENVLHGFRVNNRKPSWLGKSGKLHYASKPVLITNRSTGEEKTFESGMLASKALGLTSGSLTRVLHGKYKFTKEYYARFL